jgi:predicted TIM-barrel fold metal-dependent hydrolase
MTEVADEIEPQAAPLLRIDSHLHLWTSDQENFPWKSEPPRHLNEDGRATHESYLRLMDEVGISQAVVVQPVNYGQDYRYTMAAMDAHPERLRGMFVADPTVPAEEAPAWMQRTASSHPGWVGLRFNPYLWPEDRDGGMADATGHAMFAEAGRLGLVVGFMTFKGLSRHVGEIEALLQKSPQTQVIIDHWGFFLQPALGFGDDRTLDESSWESLLRLSRFPQLSVKLSAFFRVAADGPSFTSLSGRLEQLLKTFGSQRLLWGSDFPYATEHTDYTTAVHALEQWPVWRVMSQSDRENLSSGTAARLFKLSNGAAADEPPSHSDL